MWRHSHMGRHCVVYKDYITAYIKLYKVCPEQRNINTVHVTLFWTSDGYMSHQYRNGINMSDFAKERDNFSISKPHTMNKFGARRENTNSFDFFCILCRSYLDPCAIPFHPVLMGSWWPLDSRHSGGNYYGINSLSLTSLIGINALRPRQNGQYFADGIFKFISLVGNCGISVRISLKFVPNCPINNMPTLSRIMA